VKTGFTAHKNLRASPKRALLRTSLARLWRNLLDRPLAPRRAFLGLRVIAGRRRQLQHRGALAGRQPRHHDDLAAWEFERVMMDVGVIHVDLPESGNFVLDPSLAEQAEGAIVLNLLVEGDLGAGQQTNRNIGLADGREAAGD
jgi:hypothetical protein